ncbi:MAG: ThiF family adenylyltransferase [Candidatus Heimdallarchaeota archaeon]|nr:ThiF family adenylyltransferase [Candidatus Heimdallarchaeota archaeon]
MENNGGVELTFAKPLKILVYPSFKHDYQVKRKQIAKSSTLWLSGRYFDDYTLYHVTGLTTVQSPQSIGVLTLEDSPLDVSKLQSIFNFPFLHATSTKDFINLKFRFYLSEGNTEVEFEFVNLDRLFVRIDQKETPLGELKKKKVAIIGMGSGGSLLALYLAKSGVKNFIFIDDDLLETHNIIRHICDLSQLGRFKTRAVKDYILARIPDVQIETIEQKFVLHTKKDFDFFLESLQGIDLIAAVSGEHDVNYAINDFVHTNQLAIPLVYAGTFAGVKGGLMFKVDPRKGDYCYHCVYAKPETGSSSIPTTIELEHKITYDRTLQEQLAQPGLGLDVDNLTLLLAKFCLDLLLTGIPHGLYHFPYNFYMWYNRTIKTSDQTAIKYDGLELYYYEDLTTDPTCPFHSTSSVPNFSSDINNPD